MTIMTSVAEDGNDAQEHFGGKNHRGCTACGVFRAQVHQHSLVHNYLVSRHRSYVGCIFCGFYLAKEHLNARRRRRRSTRFKGLQ